MNTNLSLSALRNGDSRRQDENLGHKPVNPIAMGSIRVEQRLRRGITILLLLASHLIVDGLALAQLNSSTSGGADSQGPAGCACACPPPQCSACLGGCSVYCDSSATTRCATSIGLIPGYGNVIGLACSDYGLLRARAQTQPTNTAAGMKFASSANFTDRVIPTIPGFNGLTQAIVKVTFQAKATRSGYNLASGDYRIDQTLQAATVHFDDFPVDDTRTLSAETYIGQGNGFSLVAGISLSAGLCSAPLIAGDADYYSGPDYGIRITQIAFFYTNGVPLTNVIAIGNSGTLYYGCLQAPTILANPESGRICQYGETALAVSASNAPAWGYLSYQWRSNGIAIPFATNSAINVSLGSYDVVVANGCGSVTSATAVITAVTPPGLLYQPTSQTVCEAGTAVFFVLTTNSTPSRFQWRKNGAVIAGANQFFYAITNASTSDEGSYSCVVSNECGTLTSSNATLGVVICILVSTNQVWVPEGGNSSFTVQLSGKPSGSKEVSAMWISGDTNISVSAGGSLHFNGANWDSPQSVNLSAAIDDNALNDSALFTVSAPGLSNVLVTAFEMDKNAPSQIDSILTLASGMVQLRILGFPNANYIVDATTNLSLPLNLWEGVAAGTANSNGVLQLPVGDVTNYAERFFRVRKP